MQIMSSKLIALSIKFKQVSPKTNQTINSCFFITPEDEEYLSPALNS